MWAFATSVDVAETSTWPDVAVIFATPTDAVV
jgi:hypothetical protein